MSNSSPKNNNNDNEQQSSESLEALLWPQSFIGPVGMQEHCAQTNRNYIATLQTNSCGVALKS